MADGRVYYGTGGGEKRFCLVLTFQRWARRVRAQRKTAPRHVARDQLALSAAT